PGDLVILIAYAVMKDSEARRYRPSVVFVDADNRPVDLGADPAARTPDASELLSPR
ncbi:aspartate 1-decarboxylase, partial [Mycobacterium sp. ITM-2017-0098]